MQLTQATDYAFRTVQHLAAAGTEAIVQAQNIAEQEEIPLRFLLKIMRSLMQAGIIKSFRGAEGGYALARPPAQITLLDVIMAVEGPIRISRCLVQPDYCSKNYTEKCPVHQVLDDLQSLVTEKLSRVTFAALAGTKKEG